MLLYKQSSVSLLLGFQLQDTAVQLLQQSNNWPWQEWLFHFSFNSLSHTLR